VLRRPPDQAPAPLPPRLVPRGGPVVRRTASGSGPRRRFRDATGRAVPLATGGARGSAAAAV